MNYLEIKGDLFTASEDRMIAHCISSDFALGAGVAKEINKRFDTKFNLFLQYNPEKGQDFTGQCLVTDRILNLVTKYKCYHKPTYDSLKSALLDMRDYLEENDIKKIAMPKIGCGLDKLDWEIVRPMIFEVFKTTDIDIEVYCL